MGGWKPTVCFTSGRKVQFESYLDISGVPLSALIRCVGVQQRTGFAAWLRSNIAQYAGHPLLRLRRCRPRVLGGSWAGCGSSRCWMLGRPSDSNSERARAGPELVLGIVIGRHRGDSCGAACGPSTRRSEVEARDIGRFLSPDDLVVLAYHCHCNSNSNRSRGCSCGPRHCRLLVSTERQQ